MRDMPSHHQLPGQGVGKPSLELASVPQLLQARLPDDDNAELSANQETVFSMIQPRERSICHSGNVLALPSECTPAKLVKPSFQSVLLKLYEDLENERAADEVPINKEEEGEVEEVRLKIKSIMLFA